MTTQVAKITFDGGTRPTNPGNGYGSWQILLDGVEFDSCSEVHHGDNITSNQAEWMTLIHALDVFLAQHGHTLSVHLDIWSDSMLVVKQLKGRWKCRDAKMRVLRECAVDTLLAFHSFQIQWHSRVESVALFGH